MTTAPPIRNAAQWASEKRIMPPGSPVPGPFNTDTTPYMKPVCEAFAHFRYNKITFAMGTQMGKSATMQNVIGWRLDDYPAPLIYVGPTESNINNVVEPKFMDMFRECPSLWLKFDPKSTKHKKRVAGVSLRFAWAGSATELASDSAVLTMVDELDRPDSNATGEGDLAEICEARGDAYADSKLGLTSTPTIGSVSSYIHPDTGFHHWSVAEKGKVFSPIWLQWQQGTRHEWAVPCHDCSEYFIPKSELLWWKNKDTGEACTPVEASQTARLICSSCGCMIEDHYRKQMNSKGVAIAPGQSARLESDHAVITQAGEEHVVQFHSFLHSIENNAHFSIWVSGLCSFSSKKSYGFLARKLLQAIASGDPSLLMSVYNTGFGEVFSVAGDAPMWEEVYSLRSSYLAGDLPADVETIICTVDVQKNRLVYVVRGWLVGMSSRLVEHGELWGDTAKPAVWLQLDELMIQNWNDKQIELCGVDCGYNTDEVHTWVRRHKGRARALMGYQHLSKPFRMTKLEVSSQGKARKRGDRRWDFDASLAKSWVHARTKWVKGQIGDWLLPADITEDYCKQIVAEEYDEGSGRWRRINKDNHYLDCEGMQYMCAKMMRIDRRSKSSPENVQEKDEIITLEDETEEVPTRKKSSGIRICEKVPMKIPNHLSAGTSIKWQFTSQYAVEGWHFSYLLRGKSAIDIGASVSGDTVTVDVSASMSKEWIDGLYEWKLFITKNDEVIDIDSGRVTINPDFSSIASGHDARSHARRMLDSINNVLEGRILSDHERYSIDGRSLDRIPIAELHRLRKSYIMKVRAEERGGSFHIRRVVTRFKS